MCQEGITPTQGNFASGGGGGSGGSILLLCSSITNNGNISYRGGDGGSKGSEGGNSGICSTAGKGGLGRLFLRSTICQGKEYDYATPHQSVQIYPKTHNFNKILSESILEMF